MVRRSCGFVPLNFLEVLILKMKVLHLLNMCSCVTDMDKGYAESLFVNDLKRSRSMFWNLFFRNPPKVIHNKTFIEGKNKYLLISHLKLSNVLIQN